MDRSLEKPFEPRGGTSLVFMFPNARVRKCSICESAHHLVDSYVRASLQHGIIHDQFLALI